MKKVLLVYCNLFMEPLLPLGIALISAQLEEDGYDVELFDTTLYPSSSSDQEDRVESLQVKPVDYVSIGVKPKDTNLYNDFAKKVLSFEPDAIGFSVTESTYNQAKELIEVIGPWFWGEVVFGGVFATFASDYIRKDLAWYKKLRICVGEGEYYIQNKPHVMTNLDKLPTPDFSLWDDSRIYRPMDGKLYRMLPVEMGRGCLYHCSYCSAPSYARFLTGWRRQKDPSKIIWEMCELRSNYKVEYFYLVSETFLAMSKTWKNEFYEKYYKGICLPFWMNTRPETVNEYDIAHLAKIGCHRISMGLECGNEEFRKNILNRKYSNEQVIKAAKTIKKYGIQLSINNMIGFPDETKELIEETIEVNKKIEADSHTVSVFQPYRGTELYVYCVDKGYFPKDSICGEQFAESVLDMPQISKEEIRNYYLTFNERLG